MNTKICEKCRMWRKDVCAVKSREVAVMRVGCRLYNASPLTIREFYGRKYKRLIKFSEQNEDGKEAVNKIFKKEYVYVARKMRNKPVPDTCLFHFEQMIYGLNS